MQIRIHGRGGQGVVTAAEMLSVAAFHDGKHAQAFPSFGSERMGAPVAAFCRIAQEAIRTREAVTHPDVLIVQDPTLLHHVDLFAGLSPDGYVLINSAYSFDELGIGALVQSLPSGHVCALPASGIGLTRVHRPVANTPLLGGFAAMTGWLTIGSIQAAIRQKFSGALGESNAAASQDGYDYVTAHLAREGSVSDHARTT